MTARIANAIFGVSGFGLLGYGCWLHSTATCCVVTGSLLLLGAIWWVRLSERGN